MKKFNTCNSSTQRLNSDFTSWAPEKITATVASLKSRAEAFNCKLVVTGVSIRLENRNGDMFTVALDDYWHIESIEFNMGGSAIRGDISELDDITEQAFDKLDALNELKQAWREISQWLDLIAYAKEHNLNSNRHRNLKTCY